MISTQRFFAALLLAAASLSAPVAFANHHEEALPNTAERSMAIEVEATVVSVDMDTRELVLEAPTGERFTTVVDPAVQRLGEVAPGDRARALGEIAQRGGQPARHVNRHPHRGEDGHQHHHCG